MSHIIRSINNLVDEYHQLGFAKTLVVEKQTGNIKFADALCREKQEYDYSQRVECSLLIRKDIKAIPSEVWQTSDIKNEKVVFKILHIVRGIILSKLNNHLDFFLRPENREHEVPSELKNALLDDRDAYQKKVKIEVLFQNVSIQKQLVQFSAENKKLFGTDVHAELNECLAIDSDIKTLLQTIATATNSTYQNVVVRNALLDFAIFERQRDLVQQILLNGYPVPSEKIEKIENDILYDSLVELYLKNTMFEHACNTIKAYTSTERKDRGVIHHPRNLEKLLEYKPVLSDPWLLLSLQKQHGISLPDEILLDPQFQILLMLIDRKDEECSKLITQEFVEQFEKRWPGHTLMEWILPSLSDINKKLPKFSLPFSSHFNEKSWSGKMEKTCKKLILSSHTFQAAWRIGDHFFEEPLIEFLLNHDRYQMAYDAFKSGICRISDVSEKNLKGFLSAPIRPGDEKRLTSHVRHDNLNLLAQYALESSPMWGEDNLVDLVKNGLDINGTHNDTPYVMSAIQNHHWQSALMLIEKGCTLPDDICFCRDPDGQSLPLYYAFTKRNSQKLKNLLEKQPSSVWNTILFMNNSSDPSESSLQASSKVLLELLKEEKNLQDLSLSTIETIRNYPFKRISYVDLVDYLDYSLDELNAVIAHADFSNTNLSLEGCPTSKTLLKITLPKTLSTLTIDIALLQGNEKDMILQKILDAGLSWERNVQVYNRVIAQFKRKI